MTSEPVSMEARSRLRMIVNRTTDLAPLKTVATNAIRAAEDERSAAMDLATVISSDQVLTARLLKLSNSAYYGHARRIGNVREAVILLGVRTIRSVAISSGIIEALNIPEPGHAFDQDLFWAHSVNVALVAEAIARETRIARPEDAFTAGVLHDVGKLAMMLAAPDMFAEVVDLVLAGHMTYGQAELAVFALGHEQVGARLAERWGFAEPLVSSIRLHHPARPAAAIESLSDTVAAANLACNREGLACGFDWTGDDSRKATQALHPAVDRAILRVHGGMPTIEEKARAFLLHVTARTPRWYAARASAAGPGERPGTSSRDAA